MGNSPNSVIVRLKGENMVSRTFAALHFARNVGIINLLLEFNLDNLDSWILDMLDGFTTEHELHSLGSKPKGWL